MKLKALAVSALIAIFGTVSVSSMASSSTARTRRADHPVPVQPQPQKPKPKLPGFPPGVPTDPSFPTIPSIPPPGKPNPQGEPGVPFPMSITLPFPWGNIEGMWKVVADGVDIYYSFSVAIDTSGHQYLRVLQVDSSNGSVLAEGVGVAVENDKLVRAAMTSKQSGTHYMLFIGSYKNTNSYVIGGQTLKSVTVITLRPFNALMGDKDVQVIVTKVSNIPFTSDSCTAGDLN